MANKASDFTETQYKAITGQININEAQGIIECFVAAIGNKDSVGDICLPGCFNSSLKRRKPRVVWGHNWNEPIGKVLEIYEVGPNDPRLPAKMRAKNVGGLFAKVQFNLMSERGKEAFNNVAFFGEEQEWSIGYKTLDAVYDTSQQANLLKEVELYEVSPVLHGANQLTATLSIKSDDISLTDEIDTKFHNGIIYAPAAAAQNPVVGKMGALARSLNIHFGGEIVIRSAEENMVIFDLSRDGVTETLRAGYHTPNNIDFMFGPSQQVRAEVVYMPIDTSMGSRTDGSDGDCGCGCGGNCGNEKSLCTGDCGENCCSSEILKSWEQFKSSIPGTHLFVKTQDADIYDAALEVSNYHQFNVELLSDGFAIPNIDWYGKDATNALISACDGISKKGLMRAARQPHGVTSAAAMTRVKPAEYDGDSDGFVTGPTGLDNIPYRPGVSMPGRDINPLHVGPRMMPETPERREIPDEIPEQQPIKKPMPRRIPKEVPQEIPQKEPQKEPIKEPQKEPERTPKRPDVPTPTPTPSKPTPAPVPQEPTRTPPPDVPEPPGRPKRKPKPKEVPEPTYPGRTKPGREPGKKPKRQPGPKRPIEPGPAPQPKPEPEKPEKEPLYPRKPQPERPKKPKKPNPFEPEKQPEEEPKKPIPAKPEPAEPARPEPVRPSRPQRVPVPARKTWKSAQSDIFISVSETSDMQVKTGLQFDTRDLDAILIEVPFDSLFEAKSLLDNVFDYYGIKSLVTENGITIYNESQISDDAIEAMSNIISTLE